MRTHLVAILFCFGTVYAQESPKVEIFGGYSYAHAAFSGAAQRHASLNGWNASVTGNFNRWFGVTVDFGGHFGAQQVTLPIPPCPGCPSSISVDTRAQEFLAGPQISYRGTKATPFAHALFGGVHVRDSVNVPIPLGPSFSLSTSETAFGMALGGGIDYRLTPELAWRTQVEYLPTRLFSRTQNNARVSTGLVLRF